MLVPDWTGSTGSLGCGNVHAFEQGGHFGSHNRDYTENERREKGGVAGGGRGSREEVDAKGGNRPSEFPWQIPCTLVTVTGNVVTKHGLSRNTLRCKPAETGINSVRTTHKDRTEERSKLITTWDLISASVGTETAAVMPPDVLAKTLPV